MCRSWWNDGTAFYPGSNQKSYYSEVETSDDIGYNLFETKSENWGRQSQEEDAPYPKGKAHLKREKKKMGGPAQLRTFCHKTKAA